MREFQDGASTLQVTEVDPGRFRARLLCAKKLPTVYTELITTYPMALIERIVEFKGVEWTCDEIARDQCPEYVATPLIRAVTAYVPETRGLRVLDFGCGTGSSSIALSKNFAFSEIVGMELSGEAVTLARAKAAFYGLGNITFVRSSPDGHVSQLEGSFDLVVLNAVVEHLLPDERKKLLPALWDLLTEDGILLLRETPHRYFPLESHTTGLWGINYLPDGIAHWAALRFSDGVKPGASWPELLRAGIRGATLRELEGYFRRSVLVRPEQAADLWYSEGPPSLRRRALYLLLRSLGVTPYITGAFRKKGEH